MESHKPAPPQQGESQKRFTRRVGAKQERKIKARRHKNGELWLGLRLLGMLGWSVVVPTLLGLSLGLWLDRQWPLRLSWTLTMMLTGLVLGCWNAWHWVSAEQARIEQSAKGEEVNHE